MMKALTLVFALLLVCMGTGAAVAQTPDGDPPSQETICDDQTGAAYGLCNAFCEAMDCESDDPQASATACDKVKSKYQQITGEEPPCLEQPLQCVCYEELPAFFNAVNSSIVRCDDFGSSVLLTSPPFLVIRSVADPSNSLCSVGDSTTVTLTITEEQALQCNDFLRARAAEANVTCN